MIFDERRVQQEINDTTAVSFCDKFIVAMSKTRVLHYKSHYDDGQIRSLANLLGSDH